MWNCWWKNYPVLASCLSKKQSKLCHQIILGSYLEEIASRAAALIVRSQILPMLGQVTLSFLPEIGPGLIETLRIEIPARRVSRQTGLSGPTVLEVCTIIWKHITAHSQDGDILLGGQIEVDDTCFGNRPKGKRGRGAQEKTPVPGILERNDLV